MTCSLAQKNDIVILLYIYGFKITVLTNELYLLYKLYNAIVNIFNIYSLQ